MNAVDAIADAALSAGYRKEAIMRDYAFADVFDPENPTREVPLAAFSQTPPSYRSAALAVVPGHDRDVQQLVRAHRALGAPLLFVIEEQGISTWQVRGDAPRRLHQGLSVDDVPTLFEQNLDAWHPDAIHRAKSIAAVDQSYQLDFVDVGLMPALESEIHTRLDRLLAEMIAAASSEAEQRAPIDTRHLFRVVFRLLAAKVLQDRRHPEAQRWHADDLASTLNGIESYYTLSPVPLSDGTNSLPAFSAAWECLRRGISFANISSDDLAFVYENTLVTPETREHFGTHSTPHQLAEYAVTRLGLHDHSPRDLHVYEPFAGAGTFLVSALRHIRELLPVAWSDQQRHDFLVQHIGGDEIDAFACEVATLSLILADYPNRNGWRIGECDLFVERKLQSRLREHNVVLCNPPFQDFTAEERSRYSFKKGVYSKAIEALDAVLAAQPLAFAFVLPNSFVMHPKFGAQRRRIESRYSDIEIVDLPEGIFRASDVESALVIAQQPRSSGQSRTRLCSTKVSDTARVPFLKSGQTTWQRSTERDFDQTPSGDLWIHSLERVWSQLDTASPLGDYFTARQGMRWVSDQERAWSTNRRPGYRRGLHSARGTRQFVLRQPVWLDCRPERIRGRTADRPWERPKLLVNAGRLSRGPWRIGAILDTDGLLCSQQYFALWPHEAMSESQLLIFAAILNGPVANAFLATHSPAERIRMAALKQIPVPLALPSRVVELAVTYISKPSGSPWFSIDRKGRLRRFLRESMQRCSPPTTFQPVLNENSWATSRMLNAL